MGRLLRYVFLPFALVAMLLLATGSAGLADDVTPPDWAGKLPVNAQVLQLSDPASAQEELPGLGHKFQLFGEMHQGTDPENATGKSGGAGGGVGGNETITDTTTPATSVALAFRNLPPGIKIAALDTQLGFKYYFVAPRTCGGGSPRVTLLVDSDGDGNTNFAAHGHPVPFMGCPTNTWVYENLTDNLGRWEVTPGGAVPGIPVFPFSPWDTLEAAITTTFPNHKILGAFLVEDSCSFFLAACGTAHFDLLTLENRTLEIWQDAVDPAG
jgi:hypothetical protein